MASEVLFDVKDRIGTITLNRPSALNSLTLGMVREIRALLERAAHEGSGVDCIVVKGAGGKAFCAGGDVKAVVAAAQAGDMMSPNAFFQEEYAMNLMIARCPLPYVSLLDGIVMGGGVGLSVHGHFRVATERTVFAMPECAIGLFPDVGATFFLGRLPGAFGVYLGTTGTRITGVTTRELGLTTHYLPHAEMSQLEAAIHDLGRRGQAHDISCVAGLLDGRQRAHGPLPLGMRRELQPFVDVHFSQSSMEAIVASLQQAASASSAQGSSDPAAGFARDTLTQLAKGSPLSQKLTLAAVRRAAAAHLPLSECLQAEGVLASRFLTDAADFKEGVTAVLVEKGVRPAAWRFPNLEQVPEAAVEQLLEGTALAATASHATGACSACSASPQGNGCSCPKSRNGAPGGPAVDGSCSCAVPEKCRCTGCQAIGRAQAACNLQAGSGVSGQRTAGAGGDRGAGQQRISKL